MTAVTDSLRLGGLTLRNRMVATAHASGLVQEGLPVAGDDAYWGRLAAGGAAMLIGGGTVTARESSPRRGNIQEAWRPEIVEPWRRRVRAIHTEGGVAVVQLVHLGRETLGAESYWSPVAPSAVRSPREPTLPRAMLDHEVDAFVDGFHVASEHAAEAGFDGIELHAAHAYLLEQFLSPRTNLRGNGLEVLERVIGAVRAISKTMLLGIRFSADASEDVALRPEELAEVLGVVNPLVDWVNLTVGVRTTYVRDMATERPPLLDDLASLRPYVTRPLIVSHAFRHVDAIAQALDGGADLVGMTRALIADPDFPRKVTSGRRAEVRPCVACNEDCRAFDPILLCTVNPDLKPPGEPRRPSAPLVLKVADRINGPVAVVGAGPAGLECALTLSRAGVQDVVVFEQSDRIGGQLAVAADAPNRTGWTPLLAYYEANLPGVEMRLGQSMDVGALAAFGAVVLAVGAVEGSALIDAGATASSAAIAAGSEGLKSVEHVVVVDDGFAWWPGVSAVEVALAAGARVTFVTPGTAFAAAIPAESRVQLLKRLSGDLTVVPLTAAREVSPDGITVTAQPSGRQRFIAADRIIAVGERRSQPFPDLASPTIMAIGDSVVPRRAAHAIAEGRTAGVRLAAALGG